MLVSLTILLVSLVLSLQLRPVQNYIAHQASEYLSDELQTTIQLESIYFKPFSSIQIKKFFILDQERDTLLYFNDFQAKLDFRSIWDSKFTVNGLTVKDGKIFLKKNLDSTSNLKFLKDYFAPQGRVSSTKKKKKFDFRLPDATLENIEFRYRNYLDTVKIDGVDFGDIHIYGLSGKLNEIDYVDHLFKSDVQDLTFKEKSGLFVKRLSTKAVVDTNQMEFTELDLALNSSYIKDYVLLEYTNFSDFSDFINKVSVKGKLKNSRVTSKDIALFAPEVNVTNFDVLINGDLSGKVNDIQAKKVQIRTGKRTWLQGDVTIRGLPNINQTLFDLNLSQLITDRKDLEKLVADLSGQQLFELPVVFDRFGKLSYQGRVTGFYNDFITKGLFKTNLGDVIADINLEIKGNGKYSGELLTENFDLGGLLQNDQLGIVALRANAVGEGFALDKLNENVQASVKFFDFKGYRYENIKVDGTFKEEKFSGKVNVNDQNLVLDFAGDFNVNPGLPSYNFTAQVDKIDLNRLHFTKDTLVLSGNVESNFVGDDLNNIQGSLFVSDLSVQKLGYETRVDSISLLADGSGKSRMLSLESDILDATIHGEFDLNTFPSYFKSVAKRYLPSWETKIIKGGAQEFDMELVLKDFAPLSMIFAPDVKIPEEVIVAGRFSSGEQTASLNGLIPVISYKGIEAHHLIFDQTTSDEHLNFFITSDRINFTDSLYINNVNFANVLQNDSLNFNIKLSDLDATNQLDLNGLMEFDENAAIRLSLLPSNVIINHEEWKIKDKVRLDFDDAKVFVKGLELSQGDQLVKINGAISKREEDVLTINIQDFLLKTLNPIAKSAGIELAGVMNGDVDVKSVLKNPYVQTNIHADGIKYNNTAIGDLVLVAGLDQASRLVNMEAEIKNEGRQSLAVDGTYNAMDKENALDLTMRLNDSQLILFEPFLKNLVSDLSGTATAEFFITGSPFNPVIDGHAKLNNSGFVVNYLKTPYMINDEVRVEDSKIILNNLVILDRHDHKAIAVGTVDMAKPLNPTIHVEVKADNFMVLNTSARDNPLYYGLAYGTGDFSFQGPTDNMNIRIQARTNAGTTINIPLNAAGTITEQDFITFVTTDSTAAAPKTNYFQGLTMTMDLSVNPDAKINIFTDLGKLSGNGEGLISMNITSLGDFEMFGDYVIQKGEFEFTAQDFINKIFEINRGGSIRWTGNPTEALINLTAVYQVRTSVGPLYAAAGRSSSDQRVMTQAEMVLNGNLLHPDISFGLDFPTDSYVKDELQGYLSDANNVNQQALSLIVRRSFAPGSGTDLTKELNSTVFSAGTELAFNQLNNIISQSLNLNFVDFNIRSFNEASASIRLLKDRLILTGGVTDRRGQLNDFNVFGKDVASDVEAIYLIRKSGNLLFRASNRLNNRNFLNPVDEYVSAFGLVYRQEFDTFGEFLRRIISFKTKKADTDSTVSKSDSTMLKEGITIK